MWIFLNQMLKTMSMILSNLLKSNVEGDDNDTGFNCPRLFHHPFDQVARSYLQTSQIPDGPHYHLCQHKQQTTSLSKQTISSRAVLNVYEAVQVLFNICKDRKEKAL